MIELSPVMRFGLLLVRPGMVMMLAPGFGGNYAPARIKVGLTAIIGIALMPSVGALPITDSLPLVLIVVREIAIGAALALGVQILVAGAEFAGHLAGHQMGLSYGATVDPQSGVRNPLLSVLFANIAVMTFLMIDGHHAVLRALRQSYIDLPVGMGSVDAALSQSIARLLGIVFTLGVRLVAPVVLVLVLVEIAMALLARSAPMLNLNAAGAPVRLVVGLIMLSVMIPAVASVVAGAASSVLRSAVQMAGAFH
ncbi:MAG: flagellar biosynthetic protein FliR [Acidobacteriota bacterium]